MIWCEQRRRIQKRHNRLERGRYRENIWITMYRTIHTDLRQNITSSSLTLRSFPEHSAHHHRRSHFLLQINRVSGEFQNSDRRVVLSNFTGRRRQSLECGGMYEDPSHRPPVLPSSYNTNKRLPKCISVRLITRWKGGI